MTWHWGRGTGSEPVQVNTIRGSASGSLRSSYLLIRLSPPERRFRQGCLPVIGAVRLSVQASVGRSLPSFLQVMTFLST